MAIATGNASAAHPPYKRIWGLGWVHFLNDGAANYLPGVLPLLLVQLDLSVSLAGTIMAALLIGQGLQPVVGMIGDRLGGRSLIALGLLGSSLGGALVSVVDGVASLIVVLLAIGVSNSLFHPQAAAGVRLLGESRQGTAMSIFMIGGEIGRGVWPALASGVVVTWGLASLWVLALPALLTLPLLWRWAPSLPARDPDSAAIDWRRQAGPLSLLVGFCGLRALMIFAVVTFVPLVWVRAGGSLTTGASFVTVILVVGIVGNLAGGRLSDRVGTRPVLIIGMAAATLFLASFLGLQGAWLWITSAAFGVALFATLPLTVLIAQDILPENRSLGSGLALGFANALGALALMVLGPVAEYGTPAAALWVAVASGVACVGLAFMMPNHRPT